MVTKSILLVTTIFLLCDCTNPKNTGKSLNSGGSVAQNNTVSNIEGGPPFLDTCLCSFDYLAKIKTNENRLDVIISGKGWNPKFYSCSWIWGEIINNEFPDDSTITDFRIHLLDVVKLNEKLDSTFLSSKEFKNNLIATYSTSSINEQMICTFDPNMTGKYSKPKQWIDD